MKRTKLSQEELALKTQKEEIKKKQYLDLWNALCNTERNQAIDTLKTAADLLVINPENYTVWNLRKKLISEMHRPFAAEFIEQELVVTAGAIIENPKAYSPWYHRKWFIGQICGEINEQSNPSGPTTEHCCTFHTNGSLAVQQPNSLESSSCQNESKEHRLLLLRELELCNRFLDKDCRNFHCWNYRSFVVESLVGCRDQEILNQEFQYSYLKLTQNFSNYSAWHYRTKLLLRLAPTETIATMLLDELELVRAAYYTQPKDQSAWMYALWVIGQLKGKLPKENFFAIVQKETEHLDTLQDIEEGQSKCKPICLFY